jgi:hypothetical protein
VALSDSSQEKEILRERQEPAITQVLPHAASEAPLLLSDPHMALIVLHHPTQARNKPSKMPVISADRITIYDRHKRRPEEMET